MILFKKNWTFNGHLAEFQKMSGIWFFWRLAYWANVVKQSGMSKCWYWRLIISIPTVTNYIFMDSNVALFQWALPSGQADDIWIKNGDAASVTGFVAFHILKWTWYRNCICILPLPSLSVEMHGLILL